MKEEMIQFLNKERISVFAIKMLEGEPHASTMHLAYNSDDFTFVFMTSPEYRKCTPLRNTRENPASIVIGFNEQEMKTVQMDGLAQISATEEDLTLYFKKFPEKADQYKNDVFFTFKPTWWRYVDWNKPEGKTVLDSETGITIM